MSSFFPFTCSGFSLSLKLIHIFTLFLNDMRIWTLQLNHPQLATFFKMCILAVLYASSPMALLSLFICIYYILFTSFLLASESLPSVIICCQSISFTISFSEGVLVKHLVHLLFHFVLEMFLFYHHSGKIFCWAYNVRLTFSIIVSTLKIIYPFSLASSVFSLT